MRQALQRQVSKHPHKPSSMIRGNRTIGKDYEGIEFHLTRMKRWEATNVLGPKGKVAPGRSRYWYHRNMYFKLMGRKEMV